MNMRMSMSSFVNFLSCYDQVEVILSTIKYRKIVTVQRNIKEEKY